MRHVPESFRKHLDETLLGRLKLKMFERITGTSAQLPEAQQVRHYLADQYRSNARVGTLFGILINLKYTRRIEFNALLEPQDLPHVLSTLESNPVGEPSFLEITDSPEPYPSTLGALVYRSASLAEGGFVYTVVLCDEGGFPERVGGYAEVRASRTASEPAFSIYRRGGWEKFTHEAYKQNDLVRLVARILNFVEQNRADGSIPLKETNELELADDSALDPPNDPQYMQYLNLVLRGKMTCTEAQADLSIVKPHDLDFALSYPLNVVDESMRMIRMGLPHSMLVYWHDGALIMSDDYSLYLAYRKLGLKLAPVVIMGPLPEGVVTPTRVGGAELVSPVTMSRHMNYEGFSPELKEFMLDNRLTDKPMSETVHKLYSLFIELCSLVNSPNTSEKQLHRLLFRNPVALEAYGLYVRAEVWLGDEYRIDLLIQNELTDKRILLVELERSSLPIFTQKGRPRAYVTHALQQVEDWFRWIREHTSGLPDGLDASLPMEGLVVIGRSIDMSEDDKRRLLHLNHNRKISVITYDDLLDRIKNLIINLETAEMNP